VACPRGLAAAACAAAALAVVPGRAATAPCTVTFTTPDTLSAGELVHDGCDLVVSGTTLFVRGPHTFASVVVTANGTLTTATLDSLTLTVTGDVRVDAGSRISVDGRGHTIGTGPGVGGGGTPAGGASHGGHGGVASNATGGPTYGAFLAPRLLGSGGGLSGVSAANGGGAVRLAVGGTLRVDGDLTACGDSASTITPAYSPGGGAGGSIHVSAGTLAGVGRIEAGGGTGFGQGGGGGGGRIAIEYGASSFGGTLAACGGTAALAARAGAAGTVWLRDLAAPAGELRLANCGLLTAARTDLPDTHTVVPGALRVLDGAVAGAARGIALRVTVQGDAEVAAGAGISLDGRGHLIATGPGAGTGGSPGSGASHGGRGGSGEHASGPTYGSFTEPSAFGSGGGLSGVSAATGGGALTLVVAGTLRLDGALSARGDSATTVTPAYDPGGGAGGSIRVQAGTFAGTGRVDAGGGRGFDQGGGGGGGRIAVEYGTSTFAGELLACGAPASVAASAGAGGTVWTRDTDEPLGTLRVANCDRWSLARTDLPDTATTVPGSLEVRDAAIVSVARGRTLAVTVQGDLEVEAGAALSVEGCGHPIGTGPGAGGGGTPAPGGSHGGRGGSTGVASGPTYGDPLFPATFGSGGGMSGISAASGGGILRLDVAGRILVDGLVSARGDSATTITPSYAPGGGAGGSIRVTAGTIAGTGGIDASGGPGWNGGGGGGGGRISIESLCWDGFTPQQIRVAGGRGGGTPAEAGSISPVLEVGIAAGVIGTAGSMRDLGYPWSLAESALESADSVAVHIERGQLQLAAGDTVHLDVSEPGEVADESALSPATVPPGTWVDSHVLHLDAPAGGARARGSVTFDTQVLGLIVRGEALAASDALLRAPGVGYPAAVPLRGAELAGGAGRDTLVLSADRRTVTFSADAADGLDQVRVLTAVPLLACGAVADAPRPVARGGAVSLAPPFPNPARGAVALRFALPAPAHVRLDVFDAAGRHVARLLDTPLAGGWHRAEWRAHDAAVPPGTYFARLRTATGSRTARVVVCR
jgi:hypothetical protein